MTDFSRLTRPRYPMPQDVHQALNERGLMPQYLARPAYQQNDYIGWINRTKQTQTRFKRINQMLAELQKGDVYMNMAWKAK